jgi:hypothetical protein
VSRVRSRNAVSLLLLTLVASTLWTLRPQPAEALGEPHLQVRYGAEVVPGASFQVLGDWWFPPTNCPNKVRLDIQDRLDRKHFVGKVRTRFPVELGTTRGPHDGFYIASSVTAPPGIASGAGTLIGKQKFGFKLPVVGCLTLATKSGRAPISVLGEEGSEPPVISDVVIPSEMRQGMTTTLSWHLNEACALTMRLGYELAPGREIPAGNGVSAELPAGPQTFEWDVTVGGQPLPAGDYVAYLQCRDSGGSLSAITIKRFHVGFGE